MGEITPATYERKEVMSCATTLTSVNSPLSITSVNAKSNIKPTLAHKVKTATKRVKKVSAPTSSYFNLMTSLREKIYLMFSPEQREAFNKKEQEQRGVYPFNECEFLLVNAVFCGAINQDEYYNFRDQYSRQNENMHLYEKANRSFGDTWGQSHILALAPEFSVANLKLHPEFKGEFDLLMDDIKVELKSSRVTSQHVDVKSKNLPEKALSINSTDNFTLTFAQTKPYCCHVFMLMAVYTDFVRYYVFASHEMQIQNAYSTKCHRGSITTKKIHEGQIHISKSKLPLAAEYEVVDPKDLAQAVRNAYMREMKFKNQLPA